LCKDVRPFYAESDMLLIAGAVVAVIVVVARKRLPGGVNASSLGWMSEQWLAAHRASHSA